MKIKFLMKTVAFTLLTVMFLVSAAQADEYITNAKEIVKKANWDTMKTITVKMNEFDYEPDELTLKAGQPYKLELINTGKKKHYYTAAEFFRSIATRKVQSNKDGEIKAPYFLALEMMAEGGQLDLYFVPVKKGTYPVVCTIDDHQEQGMEGTITVE